MSVQRITVALFAVLIALVVGKGTAAACTCQNLPELGAPGSEVGQDFLGVSIAEFNNHCFVMYSGDDDESAGRRYRLRVKRLMDDGTWVITNGGSPLNRYPGRDFGIYFYEFRLVVLGGQLYAVFEETDGDSGSLRMYGDKVVHVAHYEEGSDTWEFVDGGTPLGLSADYDPGPDIGHWAYFHINGVAAGHECVSGCVNECHDVLYVAFYQFVDGGTSAIVIKKGTVSVDGSGHVAVAWTTLPTTGLPSLISDGHTSLGISAVGLSLGTYLGHPVLTYPYFTTASTMGPNLSRLDVALFNGTSGWSVIGTGLNVNPNHGVSSGVLAERDSELYVAWREHANTYDITAHNLFVKKYDGSTWSLVGTGPVHSTYPINTDYPPAYDYLLDDPDNGLTLVSWHAGDVYVDRFNGTAWQTVGLSGTTVKPPFSFSAGIPSISAVVGQDNRLYLAWQVPASGFLGSRILAAQMSGGPSQFLPEWKNVIGATAAGHNLTKTAATGWGNAGAVSTRAIASGDGYAEMTVAETNRSRMFGLSNGDTNQDYTDIDFGVDVYNNQFYVLENGVARYGPVAVTTGDVLRVAVESGVVRYYINGTLQYTSTATPAYPLACDTALYDTGATIQDAVLVGNLVVY